MRIGIDARNAQTHSSGDSTYWCGLLGGLSGLEIDDELLLYTSPKAPNLEMTLSRCMRVRPVTRLLAGKRWLSAGFPMTLRWDRVDIAHMQYRMPLNLRCKAVVTIHDVSFKRFPEFFPEKDQRLLDEGAKRAGAEAFAITAVSEYTKSEIVELYGIDPKKIHVVYAAADEQYRPLDREAARETLKNRYGIEEPFLLVIGAIHPRKNLPTLLQGFAELKKSVNVRHKLVVVGRYFWSGSELPSQIEKLGLTADVVLVGSVPHEDLPIFYNGAEMLVYPSTYEGFGLPPLEAMACGTPVITGNLTSLPEVVGEAGITVDPHDPSAFAGAINRLLSDESMIRELSVKGPEQAKKFSWDRTARSTMAVYHNAE